jgi:hypothetical protein
MIVHTLKYLFIRLPMLLLGILITPLIVLKYRMGEFPVFLRHFDDYRGRYINTTPKFDRPVTCRKLFGTGHCVLYSEYNRTPFKRYIWTAFRNSTNVLVHEILGRKVNANPQALEIVTKGHYRTLETLGRTKVFGWEYSRFDGDELKIPGIPLYIRLRIGYKIGKDLDHIKSLTKIGFPLAYVFDIGIRHKGNLK